MGAQRQLNINKNDLGEWFTNYFIRMSTSYKMLQGSVKRVKKQMLHPNLWRRLFSFSIISILNNNAQWTNRFHCGFFHLEYLFLRLKLNSKYIFGWINIYYKQSWWR